MGIPARILNEICEHALKESPNECCGLILGDGDERYQRAFRCRNDMDQHHARDPENHPRDAKSAFWMNESDQLRAQNQAEEAGGYVTAVYHSHVGAGVYLSEMDLEYAENELFPYPAADQIVIAVQGRNVALGLFRRSSPGADFHGCPIEPSQS